MLLDGVSDGQHHRHVDDGRLRPEAKNSDDLVGSHERRRRHALALLEREIPPGGAASQGRDVARDVGVAEEEVVPGGRDLIGEQASAFRKAARRTLFSEGAGQCLEHFPLYRIGVVDLESPALGMPTPGRAARSGDLVCSGAVPPLCRPAQMRARAASTACRRVLRIPAAALRAHGRGTSDSPNPLDRVMTIDKSRIAPRGCLDRSDGRLPWS
ncbi:MAG: hypothetical protein U0414_03000 [Polyangiaceae bacterium]